MKNPPFTYHRPSSLDGALALLAEHGDDAKVLAGGQSLLPVMALRLGRPDHVIDINRVPGLDAIAFSDGGVSIGALVRHATAERSDELASAAPLVHAAMPHIGHRAIRSQGTVCGSIAHADPAAEMPAVCVAADASGDALARRERLPRVRRGRHDRGSRGTDERHLRCPGSAGDVHVSPAHRSPRVGRGHRGLAPTAKCRQVAIA